MNIEDYTNYPTLYNELDLGKYNCALWQKHLPGTPEIFRSDIIKIIKTKKSWHSADKIFIIGLEYNNINLVDVDPRIHVWHPILGNTCPRLHKYLFWFDWTTSTNRETGLIRQLTNPLECNPKYYFDALLGWRKVHRDAVVNGIQTYDLQQKIFLSYFGTDTVWHPGHDYDNISNSNNSQFQVIYNGKPGALASIYLPRNIYNQTWFSIITESRENINLVSEKTAKAFLAKRFFVFFGIQHALKSFRDIGFKTFGDVIDESYDHEPNDQKRWSLAFEQVNYLCKQDPATVYKKILPILEYNQQIMLNTNWFDQMKQEMFAVAKN